MRAKGAVAVAYVAVAYQDVRACRLMPYSYIGI